MNLIISFTILLTLLVHSQQRKFSELTEIWHAQVLTHTEKCVKETGADLTLASRVIRYGEYVEDHNLMCFVRCISDNLVIMYDDGSLNEKNFLDILQIKDAKIESSAELNDICFKLESSDLCEKAFIISKCTYRTVESLMKDHKN